MSQPGITEPVTDGDSNPLASQPRPQDSSCLDGKSTNHEPVGQSSPDDRHHQGTPKACVNEGVESKKNSKRKRASKDNRNVKPKSDATSRDGGDPSLTQILGPSLDVLFATHTPLPDSDSSLVENDPSSEPQPVSPVAATSKTAGVNSRAARKPTRLTAVKQQLKLQMEENVRLVNSMRLLEREIDDKNKAIEKLKKCGASQKTQINKLSKGNDTLRRELLGLKGMDKSASNNCTDMQQKCNCDKTYVSSDLADLKDQVVSAANSLLAAVGINDTGFSKVKNRRTKPTVNCTKVSSASSLCPVQTDQVLSQMNMYLYEKCYNTPYGDMMPLVLCNALRLNMIIIGQTESGYDIGKVVCDFPNTSDKCLLVHKYKEHYDGIIIKALTPKANTANQTVVLSTRPPSISNINPFPMADPPANVPGVLDSSPDGETGNCDAPDTGSATSSSEHKRHDAPLCDMTKSVPDPSSFNFSDGPLTDYISNLKLYRKDNPKNCIIGHLNINSIRNKFEAVECILKDGLIDIFALSES